MRPSKSYRVVHFTSEERGTEEEEEEKDEKYQDREEKARRS